MLTFVYSVGYGQRTVGEQAPMRLIKFGLSSGFVVQYFRYMDGLCELPEWPFSVKPEAGWRSPQHIDPLYAFNIL